VPDPRFTTNVDDLDELLSVVSVDNIDDVETLLMYLLERPLTVRESSNDDEQEPAIEVIVDSLGCISTNTAQCGVSSHRELLRVRLPGAGESALRRLVTTAERCA